MKFDINHEIFFQALAVDVLLMQNRVTNLIIYKRELFNRSRNIGTAKNIQTYIFY